MEAARKAGLALQDGKKQESPGRVAVPQTACARSLGQFTGTWG